jgi:hypothetical protein
MSRLVPFEATASVVKVVTWKSPDLKCVGEIGINRSSALTETRLLLIHRLDQISNRFITDSPSGTDVFKENLNLTVKV